MKQLSLERFFKYFFTLVSLFLIFQACTTAPAYAVEIVYDDFNGASVNQGLWNINDPDGVLTQSGGYLQVAVPPKPNGKYGQLQSQAAWSGDFDIILQYSDFQTTATDFTNNNPQIALSISPSSGGGDFVRILRYYNSGYPERFISDAQVGGTGQSAVSSSNSSSASGQLKISRVNNTVTTYFKEDAGWIELGAFTNVFTGDAKVEVSVYTGDDGTYQVKVDNVLYPPDQSWGQISGKVTEKETANPIVGLWVNAFDYQTNTGGRSAPTQADGTYTITGLAPGTYRVQVGTRQTGVFWIEEFYNEINNTQNFGEASPVLVVAGETHPDIDFSLSEGGKISGYVKDKVSNAGIGNMQVSVFSVSGSFSAGMLSQEDGYYETPGMPLGDYRLNVSPTALPYIAQWYNDKPTSNGANSVSVPVAGQMTEGVDFLLSTGAGEISGLVTDALGQPMPNVNVIAYDMNDNWINSINTGADGTYTIAGLAPGTYKVQVNIDGSNTYYLPEFYHTSVTVEAGHTGQAINFDLVLGGRISGTVTKDTGGQAIQGLNVIACPHPNPDGRFCPSAQTQSNGSYTINGLAPGDYDVQASAFGTDYISEYYDNKISSSQAAHVNVAAGGTTQNINFGLATGGKITGKVTEAGTTNAIVGLWVSAYDYQTNTGGNRALTDANGIYTINGLTSGTYRVQVDTWGTGVFWTQEFYDNTQDWSQAFPVSVTIGETTPNIDFSLSEGGKISGCVTDEANSPIGNMDIHIMSVSGGYGAITQANGCYESPGLPAGSYTLKASPRALPYVMEWYDNKPTSNGAESVPVVAGQITADKNFVLSGGAGGISGIITNSASNPLPNMNVNVVDTSNTWINNVSTDSEGAYTIYGLAPGDYKVWVNTSGSGTDYLSEYYNDAYSFSQAATISVTGGEIMQNINIALATSGKISGTVTKDGTTGDPIAGLWVYANDYQTNMGVGGAQTQANGAYIITGLTPGQYKVRVDTSGTDYISEYYDNKLSSSQATSVNVAAGGTTQNIDFGLATGGKITGKVTEAGTTNLIVGLWVSAYDYQTNTGGSRAQTDVNGIYTITGLTSGTYRVQVDTWGTGVFWTQEFYNNTQDWGQAFPVSVTIGETTPNIDFSLSEGGKISGCVTAAVGGAPIGNMDIFIMSVSGGYGATTQANGCYESPGLPAGSYTLKASPRALPYVMEWYDNKPTSSGAESVSVVAGQITADKNFVLSGGAGGISGIITNAASNPLPNMNVNVVDTSNTWINNVNTGSDGTYTIYGLAPGQDKYKVWVDTSGSGTDYLSEYYNDAYSFSQAATVTVTGGAMQNINIALATSGKISGTVTKDGTSDPIEGLWVYANDYQTNMGVKSAQTDANGTYIITGLTPGQYKVRVDTSGTYYISEYYDNKLSSSQAAPVNVNAGGTTADINFGLATGGKISGIITADGTANPIAGLSVTANTYNSNQWAGSAQTNAEGVYTITGLAPGQYRVNVNTRLPGVFWAEEFYSNTPNYGAATAVTVTADLTTSGIDFALSQGGKISGYVKDEAGNPIGNMFVNVNATSGSWGAGMSSQADGYYETPSLPPGSYTVSVQPSSNHYYLSEWYDNSPTSNGAKSISIVLGQVIQNINFSLTSVGRITGKVTREVGGGPLQGIEINLTDFATGAGRTTVYTGSDGMYSIKALPGSYRIMAAATAYDYEYYNNAATYGAATQVAVNVGQDTAGIDFALALGGVDDGTISFSRTVTDKNGIPISGATVEVVGAPAITTTTDTNGAFTLSGIPAGNPFVVRVSIAGYLPTYSSVLTAKANMQGSPFILYATRGDVNASWISDGAISGKVDNRTDNNQFVEGATVVVTSASFPGTTYTVYYCDDNDTCRTDQGTHSNGRFLIPNVPGDTVIVQAFKDGWSFDPKTFRIFTDGVATPARIHGIPTPSDLTFAGYVVNNVNAPLSGVAAQMVGNGGVTATTDGSGSYNVTGLPNNAGFYMKYSKDGYLPVYSSVISSITPISLPSSWPYVMYTNSQLLTGAGKSTIMGRVRNPTNGNTIGGAVVTLHSAKSPNGNAYVVYYCPDAGNCTDTLSGTYSNGKYVAFNVDAGEAIVVKATKNGYDFSDSTIVTFADAVTETSIYPSMGISSASVENLRMGNGSYYTLLIINIDASFTGSLPDGITITVTGPNGNVIATKADFTYNPQNRQFWARLSGQAALGDYTFSVTGNGVTVTTADVQIINRTLPVPDKSGFIYTLGYNPTFFWQALNYTETPLYYRLYINDMFGNTVYSTGLVLGMLSHRVPAGILQRGQSYQFQIRAADSSNYAATQNSTRSDYVTFTVPILQTVSFSGTLKDKNDAAISGAKVETMGTNPAIITATDANGAFTLSGLPVGNPFGVKFSKTGYLPTYSAALNLNGDSGGHTFTLYGTRGDVNALWTSQGAIWGRVDNRDDNNVNVEGATVVVSSTRFPGTTYPVYYCNDSGCRTDQGTHGNGRFLLPNVQEETVIVQAFKDGWSFDPRTIHTFTDGVATSRVHGIPTAGNVTYAGYAMDNLNAALPGVTVQMVGNDAVTATTNDTGYFNLAGLPNNAGFYMKYSKAGYIPVYTPLISSTGPINNPSGLATKLYQNSQFSIVSGNSAIIGKVIDTATGAPVGGAIVTIDNPKGNSDNSYQDNPYTVQYCNDSGACSSSPSGTNSNGLFVVNNVTAGEMIVARAQKEGWNFSDRVLVTFAGAITEMIIKSSIMAITPTVENEHAADDSYSTFLSIQIANSFTGSLPDGISAINVTGPNGAVIAAKQNFAYDPQFRQFTARLPGQPVLGDYTFTVTGSGMTVTGEDVQTINRDLPIPDKSAFRYILGATPTFSWPALEYTECPLYYRLVINDMSGSRVYATNRVLGMLSHTVPAGTLQMGQTYKFEVRAGDSSDSVQTQNSSRSGWVTFTGQGSDVIMINPEPAGMNTAAPWTLTGPSGFSQSGTGDQILNNLSPGDYTLAWGDVAGWGKPSPDASTKTISAGGTITFAGTYTPVTETVTAPTITSPAGGSYTASGSISSLGHTVEYQFDWKGDGTLLSPWGAALQSHVWDQAGDYTPKARARCVQHTSAVSDWSAGLPVTTYPVTTVTTSPGGLQVKVDGVTYTAPKTFTWTPGTSHSIEVVSPQTKAGESGTRYVYQSWSDGGAQIHTVQAPAGATTYTATFGKQYSLTATANPSAGGTFTPASVSWWYSDATSSGIMATAKTGYQFTGWTGAYEGAANPTPGILIDGPKVLTASFGELGVYTVTSDPVGRRVLVDVGGTGTWVSYTTPRTFSVLPGTTVGLNVASPQSGTTGTRYVFQNWSDGGAQSRTVTTPGTYTVNFKTQYSLTTASNPSSGGLLTPAAGVSWWDSGVTSNDVLATAKTGYSFTGWMGAYVGTANPATGILMEGPKVLTANFNQGTLVPYTVTSNPSGRKVLVKAGALAEVEYTTPRTFMLTSGTTVGLNVASPQAGATGTRYVFQSWGDGGNQSHEVTTGDTAATNTVNFETQYRLTTVLSPDDGGTLTFDPQGVDVDGGSRWYASGQTVRMTPVGSSGKAFSSWTGSLTGSAVPGVLAMTYPKTVTANFNVAYTVTTSPAGLQVKVDGVTYTSPKTFGWAPGTSHTIEVVSTQVKAGVPGTRYLYQSWSDGYAQSHTITAPDEATTYTATFGTQYSLTTVANPLLGGTLIPAGVTWWDKDDPSVEVSATAKTGYHFTGWTGAYVGETSPAPAITMNEPKVLTGNFEALASYTVTTSPGGLQVKVDGVTYTAPKTFTWTPGTSHSIEVVSPQTKAGESGTRYVYQSWSDGGAQIHTVQAPAGATTYTATFGKQYSLTATANPSAGGTFTPASVSWWYSDATSSGIMATAKTGYQFTGWTGAYEGTANPTPGILMDGPKVLTASFGELGVYTVTSDPVGRRVLVDVGGTGTWVSYTTPRTFSVLPGTTVGLNVASPQSGTTGTRYVYQGWSDGGAQSRTVTTPGTYTVNFKTQYSLTTASNPSSGGLLTPAAGVSWWDSGVTSNDVLATAKTGYSFTGWMGAYVGTANPATGILMEGPKVLTANFNQGTLVPYTVTSNPSGRKVLVKAGALAEVEYTTPRTFMLTSGTTVGLNVASPQAGATGTRYVFQSWGDGGNQSHEVTTGDTAATNTVNFETQYRLTTVLSPDDGGTLTFDPQGVDVDGGSRWYASGQTVRMTPVGSSGKAFSSWTGSLTGSAVPGVLAMTYPKTVTANFNVAYTVTTSPAGLQVKVDGVTYTSPKTFGWAPGTSHTIEVVSTQVKAGVPGTRYLYQSWSDGYAQSHTITAPDEATTYTATFGTQYSLTTVANPLLGGTLIPAGVTWWDKDDPSVEVSATAKTGYHFTGWTGAYVGETSPAPAITMNEPKVLTGNFGSW